MLAELHSIVQKNNVAAGSLTGIGTVQRAVVGCTGEGQYQGTEIEGSLEVLSCMGNVSLKDGVPFVRAHLSLADNKGRACGGHVIPGCIVDATFEVVIHVYHQVRPIRKMDPETKLFLLETLTVPKSTKLVDRCGPHYRCAILPPVRLLRAKGESRRILRNDGYEFWSGIREGLQRRFFGHPDLLTRGGRATEKRKVPHEEMCDVASTSSETIESPGYLIVGT